MGGNSPPSSPPVPHFNYDRPARDTFWGYLYGLMWALSIAGGVYAIANRWWGCDPVPPAAALLWKPACT